MFPERMDEQRDRLLLALGHAAAHAHDTDALVAYLRQLGFDHRKFGARPEHYPAVGMSLIATLKTFSGDQWSEEIQDTWLAAYSVISTVMIDAAAEADAKELPDYWDADVVRHEPRTADVAVLTLRPRMPYPYRSGQYLSLTTSQAPQVWRPYSIANAPRLDNTLELHVRRVRDGALSPALVDLVQVGDVVRLGPPMGTLGVPATPGGGLLCVAGGTGWAQIKALIEDLALQLEPPPVQLLVGARTERDLYDWDDLTALADKHHWLDVGVALAPRAGGSQDGHERLLREVAACAVAAGVQHVQVFVAGPGPMVAAVRTALRQTGVPAEAVHNDPFAGSYGAKRPSGSADWFLRRREIAWISPHNQP